jgi:hypothetical protein
VNHTDDRDKWLADQLEVLARVEIPAELLELRANGQAIPTSQRRELLKQLRAGEVVELEVDIIATRDPQTPRPLPENQAKLANANFTRFVEAEMPAFARSFKGRPFLRDHSRSTRDRGGKIIASDSALEAAVWVMRQTISVVKPWAVEDALDGSMTEFSIGWQPKRGGLAGFVESAWCTVCDGPMFGKLSSGGYCEHWPGDVVKDPDSDERFIVELEWRRVRGRETSEVTFPAVAGTKVDQIKAALTELRADVKATLAELRADRKPADASQAESNEAMDPALCQALHLTDGATVADAVSAIARLNTERSAAEAIASKAKSDLAAELERQAELSKQAAAAEIAALRECALDTGLFAKGDKHAQLFDELAELGVDKARSFVDGLAPKYPIGQPAQSSAPSARAKQTGAAKLSAGESRYIKERGMTVEEYLSYQADEQDDELEEQAS